MRDTISAAILSDEILCDVLKSCDPDISSPDMLLWTHLCPQRYIPGVITKTGSHILYDIDEEALFPSGGSKAQRPSSSPLLTGSVYSKYTLYFWLINHKSLPLYNGRLRQDVMAERLRELFSERRGLGIAPAHFVYSKSESTGLDDYAGRKLCFVTTAFAGKGRSEP